jgi:competence ComEA-like helix-hairpin-helix protein
LKPTKVLFSETPVNFNEPIASRLNKRQFRNMYRNSGGCDLIDFRPKRSRDDRLTAMICLLLGILLYDLMIGSRYYLVREDKTSSDHAYLHLIHPNQLVLANSSNRSDNPVPALYTPFFFLPVPINSADKELLMTIKGIGPALAETIISYREQFGPFRDSLDLKKLHGIGARRAASLATELTFIEVP